MNSTDDQSTPKRVLNRAATLLLVLAAIEIVTGILDLVGTVTILNQGSLTAIPVIRIAFGLVYLVTGLLVRRGSMSAYAVAVFVFTLHSIGNVCVMLQYSTSGLITLGYTLFLVVVWALLFGGYVLVRDHLSPTSQQPKDYSTTRIGLVVAIVLIVVTFLLIPVIYSALNP